LIFAGLVGTWLVVFVPMAARSRRPMKRTSDTALASRVLERPVRTRPEGEEVSMADPTGTRYRAGRGGYDPEAAELAAQARYTFRQRVVLTLVLLAAAGAGVAVGLKVPEAWWVHGGAVALLVLYLVNLRRQVRSEQQIRARRAARYAGGRRPSERAVSGASAGASAPSAPSAASAGGSTGRGRVIERRGRSSRRERAVAVEPEPEVEPEELDELSAHLLDNPVETAPEPVAEPEAEAEPVGTSALPLLEPVPLPAQPAGTHRLELDDEDPELHYLDNPDEPWGYRRAAGQ
jgi:hypothetical protein